MTRTEHYHDPNAPRANSLVPAVTVVVIDHLGRVLLQRRSDNGLWALPGGTMDIGETIRQTALREVREETGLDVQISGLVGIYSDPRHVIEYSDGEVRQQFAVCLRARPVSGTLAISEESTDLRFVTPPDLDGLDIHPSTRLRIDHALAKRPEPFFE